MIAHVAEEGEGRGRVVVRLGAFTQSSPAVISAAVHVASAFRSQIEGLFIEDPDLYNACAHAGLREVGHMGRAIWPLSSVKLGRDAEHFAVAVQRHLSSAATAAGVGFAARVVRDWPLSALQAACTERGPWNVVAFAEPVTGRERTQLLDDAVEGVWGTTGFLAAGAGAQWREGPVLIALEDIDHMTPMVRAAERLAAVAADPVMLMPVCDDEIALDWLEGETRLLLGEASRIRVMQRTGHAGSAEVLRAHLAARKPRLIIARHGGFLVPAGYAGRALSELGCPVFLVK